MISREQVIAFFENKKIIILLKSYEKMEHTKLKGLMDDFTNNCRLEQRMHLLVQ